MYRRLKLTTHRAACGCASDTPCRVPPSPGLMQGLMQRWRDLIADGQLPPGTTFKQWFDVWISSRRGASFPGLDDGRREPTATCGAHKIDRPDKKLAGIVRTVGLLVDFPDKRLRP